MEPSDKVNIHAAFIQPSQPVFVIDVNYLRPQLDLAREAIDELRVSHPEPISSNVKAAYTSPWNSHRLNPKLVPLCESMKVLAKECSRRVMESDLAALNYELAIFDCWGIIYDHADHTIAHNHFPATFACSIYLEADEGCAPIIFDGGFSFQPKPGLAVLFPGALKHSVPANEGRRVVVAMNMLAVPDPSLLNR